jgi:chromosome segregation ATPase
LSQVAVTRQQGISEGDSVEEGSTATRVPADRIRLLEQELASGPSSISTEKQTTTTRISRLESRWEELKSRLLPKDSEIAELRRQSEVYRAKIEELAAALERARKQPSDLSAEQATESRAQSSGLNQLTREAVHELYSRSMGKLTVVMASADIVFMNPKLDAKTRESVQDIRNEAQSLLDLIRSYTLSPNSKKSN